MLFPCSYEPITFYGLDTYFIQRGKYPAGQFDMMRSSTREFSIKSRKMSLLGQIIKKNLNFLKCFFKYIFLL